MATGMAGKRMESLVPKMTSWRLVKRSLRQPHRIFDTRVKSDFFLREVEDRLWTVLACRISLLRPLKLPVSSKCSVEDIFFIWKLCFSKNLCYVVLCLISVCFLSQETVGYIEEERGIIFSIVIREVKVPGNFSNFVSVWGEREGW